MSELSIPEDGLYRIGLCVLLLHLLVSFTCYLFDYILFWILAMVQKHADPRYDYTGKDSLQLVITGDGVITDLLHVFLKGFHPANLFGYTLDMHYCLPNPSPPSILLLLVIFLLYFILILTILLKAYILRFRNRVTAYVYPDREKARIGASLQPWFSTIATGCCGYSSRRPRSTSGRKRCAKQISVCHKMAAQVAPCRIFLYKQAHCLVCGFCRGSDLSRLSNRALPGCVLWWVLQRHQSSVSNLPSRFRIQRWGGIRRPRGRFTTLLQIQQDICMTFKWPWHDGMKVKFLMQTKTVIATYVIKNNQVLQEKRQNSDGIRCLGAKEVSDLLEHSRLGTCLWGITRDVFSWNSERTYEWEFLTKKDATRTGERSKSTN